MNLDFLLFSAPKHKYTFMDFWGETIFVPSYAPSSPAKQPSTGLIGPLGNCYKATKTSQVLFSIEGALSEQSGQSGKCEQQMGTTTDSSHEDEQLNHYVPCLYLDSMVKSKYLVIYFHASGEDIKTSHGLLNYIRNSYQANVLAPEYPGYSIYRGSPSAEAANQDARTVYDFAIRKLGFQQNNIVVIGRSIGTGITLELLKNKKGFRTPNPRCAVLISPFASIKNLVKQFVGRLGTFLARQTFNNVENIMEVKCPVFIVHGLKDTLIPVQHSKELIKNLYTRKCLLTPEHMTHGAFDYYSDLVDPLREFLLEDGLNFYEQSMKGPIVPDQLYKCPQNFNF